MALSRTNASVKSCMRLLASVEGATLQNVPRQRFVAALQAQPLRQSSIRAFSTSNPLLKKRKIAAASNSPKQRDDSAEPAPKDVSSSQGGGSASKNKLDPEDPLDMSPVTSSYHSIDARFKEQLSKIAHGGRFDPAQLGALHITIKDENGHSDYPLRELAQIVPRSGRLISLLVNDKEYIKPIMSAVQSSKEFNQQPQRSEDNDLELLLTVERQRKDETAKLAKQAAQSWRESIRNVRSKHEKVLKDWKKNGTVLPDVVRKAEKELQKVQDKKMKEIDQEEADTIKQL